ncbi:MAG: alpha-galactosidase [Bryobacteraceae bacterium]
MSLAGCSRSPVSAPAAAGVTVAASGAVPIVMKSSTAEFDLLPEGYVQAYLVKNGNRITLDEPESPSSGSSDYLVSAGREIRDFALDFAQAGVTDAHGKLGARGKRVEIKGRSSSTAIEKTLAVEVYEDLPNLAIMTTAYRNAGNGAIPLDRVVTARHRLSAALADPKTAAYNLWSFQGSAYEWGKDEILPISQNFSRPNLVGGPGPQGFGGGLPVVDFWTATAGEAIGHIETLPLILSLPVKVEADGRISAAVDIEPKTSLKPGEVYSTPRTFVAVHGGDYYDALRTWSTALQRDGWTPAKPNQADYGVNWCGWGYEQDFTPAQMVGTIPKLKQLGIKWATLDYRWFDAYGDWNPRSDTFPDGEMKKVADAFHNEGFRIQLWWQPIAVEDGHGKHALPKPMVVSKIAREHPDWLILDEKGRPARLISPVSTTAAMCPALPEVQEYHRKLVERFMRDWGYDGNKMDSVFSVPRCYNPKHHHKSPDDSVNAMADVYKVIFQTTRAIKPESVTQICPCGTTPNLAWLPYEDQAVTADPVGGFQIRRRIKMFKAILGPEAAVYGDHVELSEMVKTGTSPTGDDWLELGKDFASTVGTGGVIGTKFTWPSGPPRPTYRYVTLTPEKEAHWKKWIGIYNSKMLSQGEFLNLYTIGYDAPEGYAIRNDGKMYYAFFLPEHSAPWKGEVELRGLEGGRYRVLDYANNKNLGTVDGRNPRVKVDFPDHLLLEVSKL